MASIIAIACGVRVKPFSLSPVAFTSTITRMPVSLWEVALRNDERGRHGPTVPLQKFPSTGMETRRLPARRGHVFRVAAAILVDALGRDFQHPVREGRQEVTIV